MFHTGTSLLSRTVLLGAMTTALLPSAWSSPQDLAHFDAFIRHVRNEAGSGDPERIMDCFLLPHKAEGCCAPVTESCLLDQLGEDAQRMGWKAVGRDVARFADGFVLTDAHGTMTNLHARAAGQYNMLEITGNSVKLRRTAGLDGEVLVLLDQGHFTGTIDKSRWTVSRDGHDWTPVVTEVPGIGKVKGYIGSDYVRPVKSLGDLKLTAQFDGSRWAFTGYERLRKELEFSASPPMP